MSTDSGGDAGPGALAAAVRWGEAQLHHPPGDHGPVDRAQMMALVDAARLASNVANAGTFQARVNDWLQVCFGPVVAADVEERNHRFLEESLELVQACGCTRSEALQLVDYVFNRPVGEKTQEVGGVIVTLAALCQAQRIELQDAGEVELQRIWTKVAQIRAKQAAKPKHSPLPEVDQATAPTAAAASELIAELQGIVDTRKDKARDALVVAAVQRAIRYLAAPSAPVPVDNTAPDPVREAAWGLLRARKLRQWDNYVNADDPAWQVLRTALVETKPDEAGREC